MHTLRFNVTLDMDVAQRLKKIKDKSRYITNALREKMCQSEEQKKKEILFHAYQESSQQDKKLAQDWDATAGDAL